jgi:methylglutaconyl-CoA hydratase
MSGYGPFVVRSDQGPVAVLTLNRPERRNALGAALIDQLSDALTHVDPEPGVCAVVITGAGPTFCAGMDLKEELVGPGATPEAERSVVAEVQAIADLLTKVHNLSKPTIAALNGDALAGGAGLATACDFVIAAETACIGYPEVRRGLVAAMVLHDLVRQVGVRRARSLLLTGLPIGATEAAQWGLVNRVVPADSCLREAIALGHALLASAPIAIETTKRLLAEASGRPLDLRGDAAITAQALVSEEAQEGIRAFFEKRQPEWATRAAAGPSERGTPSDQT